MKQEGYGSGYAYDHNEDEAFSGQNYFPDGMERQTFYAPTTYGYEAEVKAAARPLGQASPRAGKPHDARLTGTAGRERTPVAAKIALVAAGASAEVRGSPMPPAPRCS